MDSRGDNDTFASFDSFWITLEGSHNQHIAIVTRDRLAKRLSSHSVLSLRVSFKFVQIALLVSIGIRI